MRSALSSRRWQRDHSGLSRRLGKGEAANARLRNGGRFAFDHIVQRDSARWNVLEKGTESRTFIDSIRNPDARTATVDGSNGGTDTAENKQQLEHEKDDAADEL